MLKTVFKEAQFLGYCLGCGKPTHTGDIKIESGRGATKRVITWHVDCYNQEYGKKEEKDVNRSTKKSNKKVSKE